MNTWRTRLAVPALGLMVMVGFAESAGQELLVADLSNHLVAITTGFTGTDVLVFGAKDGPGEIVVVVRGPSVDLAVRRKRRIAGIWVNAESAVFSGVPSFYAVASSQPIDTLLPATVQARQGIGIGNLTFEPAPGSERPDLAVFREALVRDKQAGGLFGIDVARVTFLGERLFRTTVHFPANVPTGSYLVEVLLIRDGEVAGAQTTPLVISKIGVGADVYEFAQTNSAAYGLLAILGALMAGWIAHLVFRRL